MVDLPIESELHPLLVEKQYEITTVTRMLFLSVSRILQSCKTIYILSYVTLGLESFYIWDIVEYM